MLARVCNAQPLNNGEGSLLQIEEWNLDVERLPIQPRNFAGKVVAV
jgi:hypothetical protein